MKLNTKSNIPSASSGLVYCWGRHRMENLDKEGYYLMSVLLHGHEQNQQITGQQMEVAQQMLCFVRVDRRTRIGKERGIVTLFVNIVGSVEGL